MESFEEQVHKELKSKNINNKNYVWAITFLLLISGITYYSYKHQTGVIAKQTINKEFTVKNQENLQQLYKENLNNPEQRYQNEFKPKSLYDAVIVVENNTPIHDDIEESDPTSTLHEGPEVNVNDEEIAAAQIPMTAPEVQQLKEETPIIKPVKVAQAPLVAEKPTMVVEKVQSKSINVPKPISKEIPTKPIKATQKSNSQTVAYVIEPKKEFDIIKCYSLKSNEAALTILCKDKIAEFLKQHKTASKFEVIGIIDLIDEKEVIKHNKYKNVYYLGKDRVKRAKALILESLGNKVSILNHEYTLKTELENRGVVIRAYN